MSMIQEVRRNGRYPCSQKALDVLSKNKGTPSENWTDEERAQFDEAGRFLRVWKCVEISTCCN